MTPEQQLLEAIVLALVEVPGEVQIERTTDDMGVLLKLNVAPQDMGKVIGRGGNTAKAIRTLLRVVGMRNQARVNLKIVEPEGSTHIAAPSAALKSVDEALAGIE